MSHLQYNRKLSRKLPPQGLSLKAKFTGLTCKLELTLLTFNKCFPVVIELLQALRSLVVGLHTLDTHCHQ